ncbi:phosphoglucosamine mutase [Paenibacillus sepulcri]
MGKYFGTDGVRFVANGVLTPELAFKIGRCGGYVLTKQSSAPKVVIGLDTRISGHMLEAALTAGLLSIGVEVVKLGVITSPGVAYLTRQLKADAGIMVSASHNPFQDNGIKYFTGDGYKLSDETELEIERLMDAAADELPRPTGRAIGRATELPEAKWQYGDYLRTTIGSRFEGLRVVLDCANGAAFEIAPQLFRELGAEIVTIGASPDGYNINENCGSTHPEVLQAVVLSCNADLGLSFDGDADRLVTIDDKGEVLDGDFILSILGSALNEAGKLNHSTIVTTVMSNLGFLKGLDKAGLKGKQTAVGDRYVMEEMRRGGYNLGGEQSGHVIFLDHSTTGDGMLTALHLMETIVQTGRKLSDLKGIMRKYPQVLVNVQAADKSRLKGSLAVREAIRKVETELGDNGRVLVRPSGTESLVRVMVEGPDKKQVEAYANDIAEVIRRELV